MKSDAEILFFPYFASKFLETIQQQGLIPLLRHHYSLLLVFYNMINEITSFIFFGFMMKR
jgi:hypothetical protein